MRRRGSELREAPTTSQSSNMLPVLRALLERLNRTVTTMRVADGNSLAAVCLQNRCVRQSGTKGFLLGLRLAIGPDLSPLPIIPSGDGLAGFSTAFGAWAPLGISWIAPLKTNPIYDGFSRT